MKRDSNFANAPGARLVSAQVKTIHTRLCILRLNTRSGDLVGLMWKHPRVEVIREQRLGENFRLLLPRPNYEANYFYSREQRANRIEETPDGVSCCYDSLRNERETIKVQVRYHIRVVEERLEFSIEVNNQTDLPLAEVFYGAIGGQQGLRNRLDTQSLVHGWVSNEIPSIFTQFVGGRYGGGNLGIRYSATGCCYPGFLPMSWISFWNRKAGVALYYANHDVETRLSALYLELRPFNKTAVLGDNWPTPADVPPGETIGLTTAWLNFPHSKRGLFRAGPVVVQVHRGDWHEGSRIYRKWFDQHFPVKRQPSWLRKEMAWQSVIISNPEDVVVHRFKDLPRLAADAKKYGVTAFEICGWDVGGIDRGYPNYKPDPRLGTRKEFRDALARMKKIGVRPILFANVQFADVGTKWFNKELHRYTVQGCKANESFISKTTNSPLWGWGEGTMSARMGLRRTHLALISPAHPEVRRLLVRQMRDLVRDGADAIQLDKVCACTFLDFNPRLPTSPDRSLTQAMLDTIREIKQAGQKVNPEFALASEIHWDRIYQYVDVSYARMNDIEMTSAAQRYTFSEWTMTVFAENPFDFNIMNNGMRYGFVWGLAPRHLNDSMDEPLTRPLSCYVRELIRIRKRHRHILFDGRYCDTEGADVRGGKWVRHSVHQSLDGRGKASVVVNYDNKPARAVIAWPGAKGLRVELCQPFQKNRIVTLPARITLPARSCAVIANGIE